MNQNPFPGHLGSVLDTVLFPSSSPGSDRKSPKPSYTQHLCCGPVSTKLLQEFSTVTNAPASDRCSRPYQHRSGARESLHRIHPTPLQISISLCTAPDRNLNLITACSLCPRHPRAAWALSQFCHVPTTSPCQRSLGILSGLSQRAPE